MRLIQKILFFFEMRSFGVSTWWARKFGIKTHKVRLFFIYSTFATLGSTLLIYLPMAFILENKHLLGFKKKKPTIWEL